MVGKLWALAQNNPFEQTTEQFLTEQASQELGVTGQGSLVAVVVTHNRVEQLRVTVARLLASPPEHLMRLIIVDNASTDDTVPYLEAVQTSDPRITVLRHATNKGGAGGFETGMRHAVATDDPDWIVVMDDDGRPDPEALARFHAKDRSTAEAWTPAIYHPDGRICEMNRPAFNPLWHKGMSRRVFSEGRDAFHLSAPDYASAQCQSVDSGSFVGLFLSRKVIDLVGYPNGDLFIYGDDVLYSLGLREAGGSIIFDPNLRFEHDFQSVSAGEARMRPLWKTYYHHRNLLLVYRKAAGLLFWPGLVLIVPKWVLKLRHHGGERRIFLHLLVLALRDGLTARTDMDHEHLLTLVEKGT